MIKEKYYIIKGKYKKIQTLRSSTFGDSHTGEWSLWIHDCYQPTHRRDRRESARIEIKVQLSHFHGKENVEIYLDWEIKVE